MTGLSTGARSATPEQLAAARAGPAGAYLIAAGPGTGKTFTMVERFRWLVLHHRVPADAVLAVTFTEAAAAELRERLARELKRSLEEAWIGTFHGVCARLLREHAYLVGVPPEIRVLDELGQRLLVERLQARLRSGAEPGLDHDFEVLNPDEVTDLVKHGPTFALKLKGRGIGPDEFRHRALEIHAGHPHPEFSEQAAKAELEAVEALHTIYCAYEGWLRAAGRMDFDDLILQVINALQRMPDFRARCQRRFRHVLVDEFQDTNRIQLELIRLLSAPGFGNVTVVGDAKQSIYGWRDAEIENIRSRFPGVRLPLTVNRRSMQEILDLATAFIRRDPDFADEPDLLASRGSGGEVASIVMAADSQREARLVASEIRRLVAGGRRYGDIAVLAHSVKLLPREFEEELRRQGIPYVTSGGSGFFDREEVKDVLALLRLTGDPMDDGALVRVLQGPIVRLSDAELYRLASRRFDRRGMRLRDCVDLARVEGWPELEPAAAGRVEKTLTALDAIGAQRDGLTVADVLNRLLEATGYLRHCQLRARREGPRAVMNLRKVQRMASQFERDGAIVGIVGFVAHLDRIMEATIPVGEAELEAADAVRVLTVHAAKGLEFNVVFMVNLRRPNPRDLERLFFDPDHFGFVMKYWHGEKHPRFVELAPGSTALALARQERRRAVYVALTRARDLLYVSASRPEEAPDLVGLEEDDHFAEILTWALAHPEAARVVQAEQLELPEPSTGRSNGRVAAEAAAAAAEASAEVDLIAQRLERLRQPPAESAQQVPRVELHLSFSQLHQFEVCPVRYRFQQVWKVPGPPDELLPSAAAVGAGAAELGASVHRALAAWHGSGGDLLQLYSGPPAGREMLSAYLDHPLARAPTLGCEVEFNLRLGDIPTPRSRHPHPTKQAILTPRSRASQGPRDAGTPRRGDPVRVKGLVDRVCEIEGQVALVDYKTNARLDERLREAYATQLRLYGLAAERGLLPGGGRARLILFDLRQGEAHEVRNDSEAAEARVREAAARIGAEDFALRPEHRDRPCFLCAYRPICPDRR